MDTKQLTSKQTNSQNRTIVITSTWQSVAKLPPLGKSYIIHSSNSYPTNKPKLVCSQSTTKQTKHSSNRQGNDRMQQRNTPATMMIKCDVKLQAIATQINWQTITIEGEGCGGGLCAMSLKERMVTTTPMSCPHSTNHGHRIGHRWWECMHARHGYTTQPPPTEHAHSHTHPNPWIQPGHSLIKARISARNEWLNQWIAQLCSMNDWMNDCNE